MRFLRRRRHGAQLLRRSGRACGRRPDRLRRAPLPDGREYRRDGMGRSSRGPSRPPSTSTPPLTRNGRRHHQRWADGLRRAPVVLLSYVSPEAYVSRYGEPDKSASTLGEGVARWPVPYWFGDAAFAVMAVLLGAVDAGLGASVLGNFRGEPELAGVLGVPDGWRLFCAVLLGRPDGDDHRSMSLTRSNPIPKSASTASDGRCDTRSLPLGHDGAVTDSDGSPTSPAQDAVDYTNSGHRLRRFTTWFALRARRRMYDAFIASLEPSPTSTIVDIGVTPDQTTEDSKFWRSGTRTPNGSPRRASRMRPTSNRRTPGSPSSKPRATGSPSRTVHSTSPSARPSWSTSVTVRTNAASRGAAPGVEAILHHHPGPLVPH